MFKGWPLSQVLTAKTRNHPVYAEGFSQDFTTMRKRVVVRCLSTEDARGTVTTTSLSSPVIDIASANFQPLLVHVMPYNVDTFTMPPQIAASCSYTVDVGETKIGFSP